MIAPLVAGLAALALVVTPVRQRQRRRIVAALPDIGHRQGWPITGLARWVVAHHRTVCIGAGVLAFLCLLAVSTAAAIAAGAIAITLAHHGVRLVSERDEHSAHDRDIGALAALGSELRAGQAMSSGLRAAASTASEHTRAGFVAAASAVELGADPIVPLLESGSSELLASVGRMWQLSIETGCPLADAIEAIELDYRERRRHRLDLRSLLAGPSATAVMLALLPVFGLFMGSAIGARPLHTLTQTAVGGVVLITGTCLTLAGVTWTRLIVRKARSFS